MHDRTDDSGRDPYAKGAKLDEAEKTQAEQHATPPALVIHEIFRDDGEAKLAKGAPAIGWSGLAAGLSMGFSFLCVALIRSALPVMVWLLPGAKSARLFVIILLTYIVALGRFSHIIAGSVEGGMPCSPGGRRGVTTRWGSSCRRSSATPSAAWRWSRSSTTPRSRPNCARIERQSAAPRARAMMVSAGASAGSARKSPWTPSAARSRR
jgi:hypothetical protein